jgi:hypothetical protein
MVSDTATSIKGRLHANRGKLAESEGETGDGSWVEIRHPACIRMLWNKTSHAPSNCLNLSITFESLLTTSRSGFLIKFCIHSHFFHVYYIPYLSHCSYFYYNNGEYNNCNVQDYNWPPLGSSGQRSWLQIQRSGFDSRRYQYREYNWGATWKKK